MDRGTTLLACPTEAPTALDRAYDVFAVGLYDYCRWALGDDRLAADALSDALLAAVGRGLLPAEAQVPARPEPRLRYAGHRTPADGEPLRAWIFAVARQECLARRGPDAVREGGGSRFTDRDFPIPQLTLAEGWQLAHLRDALDQLDPDAQEVAELAFRHGFSAPALAAILGRPLRHVRTALADIYAHLSACCADGVAGTFAVPPFAPPPPSLGRLVREAAAVPSRPHHLASRHAPYNRAGFPAPGRRRRIVLAVATVAATTAGVLAITATANGLSGSHTVHRPSQVAAERAVLVPYPDAVADLLDPPTAVPSAASAPARSAAPSRAAAPRGAAEPSAAAKPALRPQGPGTGAPERPAPPRAASTTGMQTRIDFSYNLAVKAWDATVTTTVRGFEPAEVRVAVWWRDAAGTKHRRRPPATRTGRDTYAAKVAGLPDPPRACAQAVAVAATGEMTIGPVTGPDGYAYCGG